MRDRNTPRLRRLSVLAGALLLVGGLVACQAIPGSGSVQEGLANLDQADQPVQFNPGGPVKGASQEEIVRGFVRAGTSSVDDYAVAREFLTPTYADQWDPSLGVFVDEGTQPFSVVDERTGELSLSGVATIDEHGVLTPLPPGPETGMRFELEEVRGEWRISSAPNGIILDRSTFAAVWTPRQIYFLAPDNRLVPETHWFLNRAATLSTQIVEELLAGPSEAGAGAMRTAFPSGTVLASSSVPVSDGTAHIEFSPELLTGDADTMEQVKRQLATSLQSVPGVSGFEISVNGATVDSGPVVAPENDVRRAGQTRTAVMKDGVFGLLNADAMTPLPKIGERIASLSPVGATLSADRATAAVRHATASGMAVSWVTAEEIVTQDVRPGLTDPGLDPFGYVWSYASSDPEAILVERPGETGGLLDLPGLVGRTPVAVRVSPGGNRLAMLVQDGAGRSAVLIVGIIRDAASRPVGLVPTVTTAAWLAGTPVDLDWVEEMRVVTLAQQGAGVKVTLTQLGQLSLDAGSVPSAVEVSGGGIRSMIRVLDDGGRLYGPQGSGWQRQGDGVAFVAR